MTKYLVIDQRIIGSEDEFVDVYDTLQEANKKADIDWHYLTSQEKAQRRIFVASVEDTEQYLCDWAFEDGKVEYTAYHAYDTPDGAFDSATDYANNYAIINGSTHHIDTITGYMDDDIREQLHRELAPCSAQEFVDAYCAAHLAKYGEEFEIN